jgi:predicted MPP superfamily phosphohydrolase
MNFQIASDLHLDTRGGLNAPDSAFPVRRAPVLLLAGDVCSATDPDYFEILSKVAKPFDAVMYIPGNHEYYGSDVDPQQLDKEIERVCYDVGNVVYLNKRRVNLRNIAYIGATLWTNCPNDPTPMNDFRHINRGKFTPAEENWLHRDYRDWIKKAVNSAKREGCYGAVVMTHHAPDRALEYGTTSRDPYVFPYYFASDMSDIVHDPFIQVWVHGHTHESYRLQLDDGGPIFASNALGYEGEHTGYSNQAVLRI